MNIPKIDATTIPQTSPFDKLCITVPSPLPSPVETVGIIEDSPFSMLTFKTTVNSIVSVPAMPWLFSSSLTE